MGLGGGDVCGEELVEWCLGNSSPNEGTYRPPGEALQQLESKSHGEIGRNVKLATPILGPYTLPSRTDVLMSAENLR
ncbi:hypothetical protein CRG98_026126 [Punica granatum]|uniref:Uncharacterized protein n=1 Tax=Punica granatum TaxID=22663 RepID=A0A2I0JCP4_PUNGR|nr:hypothetical protein CRG98_026126 [Punica granatum]